MIFNKIIICFLFLIISPLSLTEELILKNAKIHTASDRGTVENTDILIRDGKIIRIGKNLNSSSAEVKDLTGKVISPGLIAPLSQLGIVEIELVPETRDDRSDIYSAGLTIDSAFNPSSTLIPYNLTGGITLSLTSPTSSGLFSGLTSVFSLSGSLEDSLISSNIALSANISGGEDSKAAKIQLLEDSLDLSSLVSSSFKGDLDRLVPEDVNYSIRDLAALKKVMDKEIPLVVRANSASDILTLIKLAEKKDINLIINGAEEGWRVAKQLAKAKIPVILRPIDNIPNSFNELGSRLDNAYLLHQSGVKILIASHETHNSYLSRQGAGIAVSYGLPWEEALKGLTSNVADVFKLTKRGSIKSGHVADIVIWSGDPLEVTTFVEEVYISGELMPTKNRSMRLKDRYISK
tara:strand:- start:18174 stop:19394 length:1221 start_codon:yes stop_codon:yes gene_type:complete